MLTHDTLGIILHDLSIKSPLLTKAILTSKILQMAQWLCLQGPTASSPASVLETPPSTLEVRRKYPHLCLWDRGWGVEGYRVGGVGVWGCGRCVGGEIPGTFCLPVFKSSSGLFNLTVLYPRADEAPRAVNQCFGHLIVKSCMRQPVSPFGGDITPIVLALARTDTGPQVLHTIHTQEPNRFGYNF